MSGRSAAACLLVLMGWAGAPAPAHAAWDLTLFLGRAFPIDDDRLVLRPSVPSSVSGVDIDVAGDPALRPDGGTVLGAAIAFEAGILAVEGRLDSADVGLELSGARFRLRGVRPPFQGLAGAIDVGDGQFELDRLYLLSLNLRLRTPGPVGLVASGGLSYLPEFSVSGGVPLRLQIDTLGSTPVLEVPLRLRVAPEESSRRFGVNGGAGVRVGAGPVALVVEARVFYFREYELRFETAGAPAIVGELIDGVDPVAFEPVIVNAQAGLVLRF